MENNESKQTYRKETIYGAVKVVQNFRYQWAVLTLDNKTIVPFGQYVWIDGFDNGLARVRKISTINNHRIDKWGIINEKGEEVLLAEYDHIWNFLGKERSTTKVILDGEEKNIVLSHLKSGIVSTENKSESFHRSSWYAYDDYNHYGEYAGTYAQDEAGYSDEAISDAFDGDPDAYWNID